MRAGKTNCLAAGLIIAAVMTGCAQKDNAAGSRGQNTMQVEQLAGSIKEKYASDETVEYQEPITGIERGQSLEVQMGFDIKNSGFDNYTQLVQVFQDSELTQSVGTHFEWDEESQVLSVTPPKSAPAVISNAELEEDVAGNDVTAYHLFDKGELKDWGNLPQYYLVQYVNAETGEVLEKPLVTVFTVKHELTAAPEVKMEINEEGMPAFTWEPVEGAETYYVMTLNHYEDKGFNGSGWVQGITTESSWTPESAAHIRTYDVSEAERSDDYNIEKYGEGTGAILKEWDYDTYYCVIAASDDGTSAVSNTFNLNDIARKVPYTEEVKKSLSEEGSNYADSYNKMPAYKWVTMCDGTLVQKLVNYQFAQAKVRTESWGEYEKEDMSDLEVKELQILNVPYVIDGTGYTGVVKLEAFDVNTWEKDLEAVKRRQEKLRNKGGGRRIGITQEKQSAEKTEKEQNRYDTSDKVFASCALSEYLAVNMLGGAAKIDLSSFPESSDQEYLMDAWMEAVYQNPMILGVKSAVISNNGKSLLVQYDTDTSVLKKKQDAIRKEVSKVAASIFKEGMTDLEKEFAINDYLCESAEYDEAALENAEKNGFQTVDEEFMDAFTPYGILINKKGVCSSYSGAFKLLADAAGLESIIVTGDLDGTLPHAWNKVKIDGNWQIVDSTNNDNEFIANAILNLPNQAADKVLVEDKLYLVDREIKKYTATDETKEYYRINQNYYPEQEVEAPLAQQLRKQGYSVLRTDYRLDDDTFAAIAQEAADQAASDELYGFHWLGVIYLTNEA